ncbi:helicase-like transcription factor CHR28 isoform X1 [Amaranthus tricolor]|uniref:helicase-like transcription factor CHR28 isoform X1 n=1 Tax=Amaranthus tricolor TaxID=29722 RepID=UPI002582ACC3|nr:helicase-like transcription factor CHR28 isoform X1 [Amaranthus tricolor]XP_057528096.1 helicase-like transcription factor CHR28 isoform X1 [Amaranthus tricolor]
MPDNGDRQRGIVEATQRFYSLFSGWICGLSFRQFTTLVKSLSYYNSSKEQGNPSSYQNRMVETIDISSGSDTDFSWSSDDDAETDVQITGNSKPETSIHTGRKLPSSFMEQPRGPPSKKGNYSHAGYHSQGESNPSTSYGTGNHSRNSRLVLGNGSSFNPKMDDERSYWNNSSRPRDLDYEKDPNKRILPTSISSGSGSKKIYSLDNLSSNRGFFSRVNGDNASMDHNHLRILPYTLDRGKPGSSTDYTTASDPFQNMGFGEERVIGDERVIFQAALQDLSKGQGKAELDVPQGVLSVPLLRHQKIALAWMVEKESRTMHCLGGILADDQGLGKTISTIALILRQLPAQIKSKSEKDIQYAEALNLDDDDDDNQGNPNNGPGKSTEDFNSKPETLILDEDDDNGNAIIDLVKEVEDSVDSHSNAASSSSQTLKRKRPSAGTLIVCPATVLRQWARELNEKVSWKVKLNVLVYHGGSRTKDPAKLAEYDVVLTTYAIVTNEVPKQPLVDEDDVEQKGERYGLSSDFVGKKRKHPSTTSKKGKKGKKLADSSDSQAGALARANWFRVVLDEAQTIKNHRTQTARACCGLRAKRRWCLSGTPIQNSVDELYSYFRFLRHHLYSNYKSFYEGIKSPISRDPNIGYKKLQAVLSTLLLRRTKETKLDGEPIINLPPKYIKMKTVKFTAEERSFYAQLEAESRSQFKAYAAAGTVNQNYANILLMILRLRQACDHPLLVKGFGSDSARRTNMEKARNLPSHVLLKLLNHLEAASAICLICSDPAEDAVVTLCGHVFCYQCVADYLNGDDNLCPARRCKGQLSADALFSKATLKACVSGDDDESNLNENGSSNNSSILSCEYSSSKIKAALEILLSHNKLNSQHVDLEELVDTDAENNVSAQVRTEKMENSSSQGPIKTIVFSQWTRMLDLFELSLNEHCIQYRRLDGSMSLAARDRAVREFNTDPEVTVMLMSLKAGNLGLNMVAACHVILLDLWWNPTTEDQAIDRAHRIGQTRPVTVSRITIQETVEDRILALQDEKRKIVASAFGEDHIAGSGARLTIEDLKYIFLGS